MRHLVSGRRLGRTSEHRKALGRNLLRGLVEHHRITTTVAKAKEYRPLAERLVTLSKERSLSNIRRAFRIIPDKTLVKKLFDVIGPHFKERNGGYTRMLRLSKNRLGDNGPRAIVEFVDLPRPQAEGDDEAPEAEKKPAEKGAAKKAAEKAAPKKAAKAGAKK